jgi:hypothetical protein
MLNSIRRYLRYSRYANFWDFVRDSKNFSNDDLNKIAKDATETNLIRPWNPFSDSYYINGKPSGQVLEETIHDLYNHFGSEIWSACLGAGGYDPERGPWGLSCIAKLKLSNQVYNQKTFEEFLVRNALKRAARDVLEERKQQ